MSVSVLRDVEEFAEEGRCTTRICRMDGQTVREHKQQDPHQSSLRNWFRSAVVALPLFLIPLLTPSGAWGVDLDPAGQPPGSVVNPNVSAYVSEQQLQHLQRKLLNMGEDSCLLVWGADADKFGKLMNADKDDAGFFCPSLHRSLQSRGIPHQGYPPTLICLLSTEKMVCDHELLHHHHWRTAKEDWRPLTDPAERLRQTLNQEEYVHEELMRICANDPSRYPDEQVLNQKMYIEQCREAYQKNLSAYQKCQASKDYFSDFFDDDAVLMRKALPPKSGTFSNPIPTTGRVVGRTPLPGPAPRACIPKVAAAPMAWAGENILQDLCEAEPNSWMSQGMGGIGQAASWCDLQLGNAPSSAAQYCGRKVSDAASWCAGDLSNQRKVESEAAASQIPVMRPAPPWYRRSPFGWGREMWKGGQQWCRGIARDGLW